MDIADEDILKVIEDMSKWLKEMQEINTNLLALIDAVNNSRGLV